MKLAIYGAGGFAREVAPPAIEMASMAASGNAEPVDLVFVSDLAEEIGTIVNGFRVISYAALVAERAERLVSIGIGEGAARRAIAERCAKDGLRFAEVRARTHIRYHNVTVGEGAVVCENTIISTNSRVGRHFQANFYAFVGHDCVVGDFVTFAPRVNCNGWVVIEDDAYIGTGAMLRQGSSEKPLVIGKGATVGMGAVVTKDVPPGVTVVGNPARVLERSTPR
ncbi:MAG TPA: NeuD/PglB/VioB family sugar acetyltransferase [Stellaceae bacterium]|jgi:sugar O-acyltransferase (sialic acid O-acetyltransferase NeuD family)|nr:NeuD/PglB/VioB family sugar acetyltransferase [Stellaceae bacterium]